MAYQQWFRGLPARATAPPEPVMQQWWGAGQSAAERARIDAEYRHLFAGTLHSLSSVPVRGQGEANDYAQQLLAECKSDDAGKEYQATLGLLLLLDQMTRHIFRDDEARLVYTYYDLIAQAVAGDALGRCVDRWDNEGSPAYRQWFYMPLLHAEDIAKHTAVARFHEEMQSRCAAAQDEAALKYTAISHASAKNHLDILLQFGRYPHRNACLARQSTPAEQQWLAEGNSYM